MNALYSLFAAVALTVQQPAVTPLTALVQLANTAPLTQLSSLSALAQLSLTAPLAQLSNVSALAQVSDLSTLAGDLESLGALRDEDTRQQDPADSLWRAARRAFDRGDYANAATLFGDIPRRYADSRHAGDAHYWGAFALYRVGDDPSLRRALTLLDTQKRRYPQARTTRDAATLRVRILSALARGGDQSAAQELAQAAQPPQPPQPAHPVAPAQPQISTNTICPNADDDDDMRIAALNGLMQMDAANAVPILKRVLAKRDPCSAGLRRKAVFILSQKHGEDVENILLDVARNDPDREVRSQAVFWLSQVPSDRAVEMLDSILRTSTDEEIQKKAVFALSQQQNPRAERSCGRTPSGPAAYPTRCAPRSLPGWVSVPAPKTPRFCAACTPGSPTRT